LSMASLPTIMIIPAASLVGAIEKGAVSSPRENCPALPAGSAAWESEVIRNRSFCDRMRFAWLELTIGIEIRQRRGTRSFAFRLRCGVRGQAIGTNQVPGSAGTRWGRLGTARGEEDECWGQLPTISTS